jgi:succinyl-CoA synthetase beta subunit
MKIHEYQGKELLKKYGVPVPIGIAAQSAAEAKAAIPTVQEQAKTEVVVVKAQIHAGGRGKGGGVKVAKTKADAEAAVDKIFGMTLITPQTGPEGKKVQRILVEQGLAIDHEFYLGILLDRATARVTVMASREGGMDIEEVAAKHPEKIFKHAIDPATGWQPWQSRALAKQLEMTGKTAGELGKFLAALTRCYEDMDCSMLEINPLVTTKDGRVLALDAKINFDDNAMFRHPELVELARPSEEDASEFEAKKWDLSYIQLDGNIGCLVNGAGLAMSTMDIIKLLRRPAGELPRRRRRRHGREGHRGLQDHHDGSRREGDLRQHLRRHHEVRHDRARRDHRVEGARTQGATRRSPRRHERRARQEDARRQRARDRDRGRHGRRSAAGRQGCEGSEVT